jgi:hypothetical protein
LKPFYGEREENKAMVPIYYESRLAKLDINLG